MSEVLAAVPRLNSIGVKGILDWVQAVIAWLNEHHPDWDMVQADALALVTICKNAMADGRLSFAELSAIIKAALKLADDLTLKLRE